MESAKIYLAGNRYYQEVTGHRIFSSIHPLKEIKMEPSGFAVVDDETIAGGNSIRKKFSKNTSAIIIPVVGALRYKNHNKGKIIITGQLHILHFEKEEMLELSNPYAEQLVNFLILTIPDAQPSRTINIRFDLNRNLNRLITNGEHPFCKISIGKFDGRKEAEYFPVSALNSMFVFVIQGVFEVQGRLLQQRDGLLLNNFSNGIDMEALGHDSIILLLETYTV